MNRVYREAPDKWPYGLNMSSFDGGVYMVREASSGCPVGFTGWQEQRGHDGKKVGYYSIGILPEYRMNGYAKAAVASLLQEKAAGVDRVEAFIVPGNKPSIALADSLGVSVVHGVFSKKASNLIRKFGPSVLYGTGNAAFFDPELEQYGTEAILGHWDAARAKRTVLNAALGMLGGNTLAGGLKRLKNPGKFLPSGTPTAEELKNVMNAGGVMAAAGTTMLATTPLKDVILHSVEPSKKLGPALDKYIQSQNAPAPIKPFLSNKEKLAILLGSLGIAGGVGLLMHRRNKAVEQLAQATQSAGRGRVRVTLPTKNPNDKETQVEMPIEDLMLSKNLQQALSRDTRRRLRGESESRVMRRGEEEEVPVENMDSFSEGMYPYNPDMVAMKQASSREDLVSAGSCCGSGCEECPYLPKHQEGATKLDKK